MAWRPRALTPLSWVYGASTGARNARTTGVLLRATPLGLPTVSVGNVSVGGTGKTPVSAWVAQELLRAGARPAILLRGYGDDEPLGACAPESRRPVIADPDRVAGAGGRVRQGGDGTGAGRRLPAPPGARDLDVVLVAAEQGRRTACCRRGRSANRRALRRADWLVVTRKSASLAEAEEWASGLEPRGARHRGHRAAPGCGRTAAGGRGSGASPPLSRGSPVGACSPYPPSARRRRSRRSLRRGRGGRVAPVPRPPRVHGLRCPRAGAACRGADLVVCT
jgi:tetraacyldisaccharide 4'-kinase